MSAQGPPYPSSESPVVAMSRRICVFGTSADPPTGQSGHVGIVRHLQQSGLFDEILVVPVFRHMFASKRRADASKAPPSDASSSPSSSSSLSVAPVLVSDGAAAPLLSLHASSPEMMRFSHKLSMCRLAFSGVDSVDSLGSSAAASSSSSSSSSACVVTVSDVELVLFHAKLNNALRTGPSGLVPDDAALVSIVSSIRVGTADVLHHLSSSSSSFPPPSFSLCLGSDAYLDVVSGKWCRVSEIKRLVRGRVVVVCRPDSSSDVSASAARVYAASESERAREENNTLLGKTLGGKDDDDDDQLSVPPPPVVPVSAPAFPPPSLPRHASTAVDAPFPASTIFTIPGLGSVSSTLARSTSDFGTLNGIVSPAVAEYIKGNGLYEFARNAPAAADQSVTTQPTTSTSQMSIIMSGLGDRSSELPPSVSSLLDTWSSRARSTKVLLLPDVLRLQVSLPDVNLVLLDVRSRAEYETSALLSALHVDDFDLCRDAIFPSDKPESVIVGGGGGGGGGGNDRGEAQGSSSKSSSAPVSMSERSVVIVPYCTIGYRSGLHVHKLAGQIESMLTGRNPSFAETLSSSFARAVSFVVPETVQQTPVPTFTVFSKNGGDDETLTKTTIHLYNGGGVVPFAWGLAKKEEEEEEEEEEEVGTPATESRPPLKGSVFVVPGTSQRTKTVHVHGQSWNILPDGYEAVTF